VTGADEAEDVTGAVVGLDVIGEEVGLRVVGETVGVPVEGASVGTEVSGAGLGFDVIAEPSVAMPSILKVIEEPGPSSAEKSNIRTPVVWSVRLDLKVLTLLHPSSIDHQRRLGCFLTRDPDFRRLE
jgi:hypothetical protein